MGLPPRRIDVLTSISGVTFDEAWPRRLELRIGDLVLPFLGRADLITNKRAAARRKELVDVWTLEGGEE